MKVLYGNEWENKSKKNVGWRLKGHKDKKEEFVLVVERDWISVYR